MSKETAKKALTSMEELKEEYKDKGCEFQFVDCKRVKRSDCGGLAK